MYGVAVVRQFCDSLRSPGPIFGTCSRESLGREACYSSVIVCGFHEIFLLEFLSSDLFERFADDVDCDSKEVSLSSTKEKFPRLSSVSACLSFFSQCLPEIHNIIVKSEVESSYWW